MANRINFNIGFTSDTRQITEDLNRLRAQLNQITTDPIKISDVDFKQSIESAKFLKQALDEAYDSSVQNINLGKFNDILEQSGKNLSQLAFDLKNTGTLGNSAFSNLTKVITNAQIPVKKTSQLLDEMWISMKNIAKWNISTSILNSLQGSLQKAYYFSKDLDTSLNNIRIVTGKSKEEMAAFAEEANKAAKGLDAATLDYTDASLIYYQQGLNDEDVKARTETTIKAANVAKTSAEQMSEYLTAIWNGYKVDAAEAELYVDKVSAVAAATASDLGELSEGFSKVASAANTMGVDVDELNAYLATVISTTREAPETIGTSFKTIFARLNSISLGESEDEWGLSEVGKTLEKINVQLLDSQGKLRDTGDVIADIGNKWSTMSKETQQAVAVAMAGKQQYSRLIALFDNWDEYQRTLMVSQQAAGALQEQADIYAESWEAAQQRVETSLENISMKAVNSDFFIGLLNGADKAVNGIDDVIDSLGGFEGVLLTIGTISTQVFNKQIGKSIDNMLENLSVFTGSAYSKSANIFDQMSASIDTYLNSQKNLNLAQRESYKDQQQILSLRSEMARSMKQMSQEQIEYNNTQIQYIENLQKEKQAINQTIVGLQERAKQLALAKQRNLTEADDIPNMSEDEAEEVEVLDSSEYNKYNKLKQQSSADLKVQQKIADIQKDISQRREVLYKSEKEILEIYEREYAAATQIEGAMLKISEAEKITKNNAQSILDIYIKDDRLRTQVSSKIETIIANTKEEEEQRKAILEYLQNTVIAHERYAHNIDLMTGALEQQKQDIHASAEAESLLADNIYKAKLAQEGLNQEVDQLKAKMADVKASTGQMVASLASYSMAIVDFNYQFQNIIDTLDSDASFGEKSLSVMSGLLTSVPMVISSFKNFASMSSSVSSSLAGISASATGAISGFAGLGASIAAAGPIVLGVVTAIGLLSTAYTAITNHIEKIKQARIDENNALLENIQNQKAEKESIKATVIEYQELLQVYKETGEISDSLKGTTDTLANSFDDQSLAIAQLTGNYDALTDAIQRNRDIQNQEAIKQAQQALEETADTFSKNESSFLNLNTKDSWGISGTKDIQQVKDILSNYDIKSTAILNEGLSNEVLEFVQVSKDKMGQIPQILYDLESNLNNFSEKNQEIIQTVIDEYGETYQNYKEAYEILQEAQSIANLDQIFTLDKDYVSMTIDEFEKLKNTGIDSLESLGYSTDKATDAVNEYLNTQSEAIQNQNLENEAIKEKIDLLKDSNINVDTTNFLEYYNTLDKNAQNQLLNFSPTFAIDWQSFKEEFEKSFASTINSSLVENKNILSQALNELFSDQTIEDSTLEKLTEVFPELADLTNQNYQYQIELLQQYINDANNLIYQNLDDSISSSKEQLAYLQEQYDSLYGWMDKAPDLVQKLTEAYEKVEAVKPNALMIGDSSYEEAVNQLESIKEKIKELYGENAIVDLGFEVDKETLENSIDEARDLVENNLSDAFDINIDLGLDNADTWISESEQLAEAANKIGENYRIAADDIGYFSKVFPELLSQAQAYSDGSIQLNKEVVDSFLAGKQTEVEGEKEAVISKLESQKAMLEAAITTTKDQLALAEQLATGQISYDQYAQSMMQSAKEITSLYIAQKYGEDAGSAFESATSQSDYIQQVGENSDAATDAISTNFWNAYDDSQSAASQSASKQINYINQIGRAAANASAAIAGMMSGQEVSFNPSSYSNLGGISGKKYSYDAGSQLQLDIEKIQEDLNGIQKEANETQKEFEARRNELEQNLADKSKEFGEQQVAIFEEQLNSYQNQLNATNAAILQVQSQSFKTQNSVSGAGKGSGGGSSGGGGGSSEKELEKLDDEIDKYHEINRLIEENNRLLDKASTRKSRLYGSNYLKALEEEVELTEKAQELDKQKLEIIEKSLAEAKKQANAAGAEIDETGQISNYYEFLSSKLEAINARIEAGSITEAELEAEKEAYELTKKLFEAYEEEFDLYLETLDAIEERAQTLADYALEKVTKEVEFKLEISDDSMKVLDYFINKNKDFFELSEKYNLMTQKYQEIPNQLESYYQGILDLQEQLNDPNADHDAINEKIREYRDGIISSLEAMNELEEEMKHAYSDALDQAGEELEKYTSQLDHVNDSLNHFINIMGLMGKEDSFDTIGNIYQAQIENGKNMIEVQKEMLAGYKEQQELLRQTGMEGTDDWFALVDAIQEAESQLYETTEDTLEAIGELYENTVNKVLTTLEQQLSGSTFDEVSSAYDRYRDEQDRFLTKTTQLYEITKLQNEIQQEIDSTDNPARKQKLKDLYEYVSGLGEQNKLSEYELKYAQAKYDLALKEMALEEAKNSKTNLRLVRNSQGNWTYQYTADEDNIASAQEEYQEALNNLYQMSLDRVSELEQEIININEEMKEALAGIERDNYETAEEYEAALLEVKQFYQQKLYDVYDQYNIARQNLEQDTHDLTLALTGDAILAAERQKEGYNQNIAEMIERLCGEGPDSFTNATDAAIEQLTTAWQDWKDAVDEVAESVQLTEDDIINKTEELEDSSEELKDTIVGEVIPAIMKEIDAVRQEVLAFNQVKNALAGLKAMYENFISTLKIAEGQAKATANAISQASSATGSIKPSTPTGGGGSSGGGSSGGGSGGSTGGSSNNSTTVKYTYTFVISSLSPSIGGLHSMQTQYTSSTACRNALISELKSYGTPGVKYTYEMRSTRNPGGVVTHTTGYYVVPKKTPAGSGGGGGHSTVSRFDSGGYTGNWNSSEGKVAVLHEKELVLNKDDTKNMLKTVSFVRTLKPVLSSIEDSLNLQVFRTMNNSNLSNINVNNNTPDLNQNVKIEATFPNVTNSSEIEDAFNNLVNEAAQYSRRK